MKIQKFYEYNPESIEYEKNNGEVITVPDQSLTVKEILERFRRGTLDYESLQSRGYYDDDDTDIDSSPMIVEDITDIEAAGLRVNELLEKAKKEASKE